MIRLATALCAFLIAPTLALAATPEAATAPIPATVEFNRDVRPILSDRCFACHGPDEGKRKAKLRLDVAEGVIAKGTENTFIIVPSKPEQSEVWKRIVSTDDDERMPPANIGNSHLKPLSDREKAVIKKWIEQGAKYEGHWAYIKPVKPVPNPGGLTPKGFLHNTIDEFIIAKLHEQGMQPSKEADRRTLIRRLSFDLIGLPPTPQEVDDFVNDKSPNAYEKVVDRLLASKHFGERFAVYWLDLVRYADSAGYHSDNDRTVWMYRDYVINAFNSNKRFDVFTREQLAGDLLPQVTNESRIASGYNKLLNTTEEGGAQPREYTAKYAADRVRNVSTVWLGATMGCCECHDHKYDPLPTKDFYSMAAFFADVAEVAVGRQAQTPIPTAEHEAKLKEFDTQIAAAQKKLGESSPELAKAQAAWEAEMAEKLKASTGRDDLAWIEDLLTPEGATRDGAFNFIAKGKGPTRGERHSRKQQAGELVQHFVIGAKAAPTLTLRKSDVLFAYVFLDPVDTPKQVMLQFNDGDWEHRAFWGGDHIPYGGVGTNANNHRKLGALPKAGEWVRLEVKLSDVGLKEGSVINGIAFTQWGGTAYWDAAGVNRDGIGAPDAVVQALKVAADQRDAKQKETIASHYREIAPLLEPARKEVATLKAQRDAVAKSAPTTLVTMAVAPRTVKILKRGNWLDDSGEVVQPQVPGVFGKLETAGRATRLDLANWLVAKENPIVSRVFVNRLWKLYFGQGLVRTLDDFGSQGAWPTHPELLDWLALEFVDKGYDVKHMVKLMVTSGSYRQSSNTTEALRQRDPFNYLLARQGRYRLEAEFVRDNAMAVSGLLVPTIGGPSVKPYQPRGYWAYLNFPTREWQNDKGDGAYRRGLYTWWQRTFPHPSMVAFDASSREEAVCERVRSNTPLQAMVLLNDPTYVEAARVLAERTIKEGGKSAVERVDFAMRAAMQRSPKEAEEKILLALFSKHLWDYQSNAAEAQKLLAIGDKPASKEIDAAELAAWTSVTRVILNLHETVTRE